MKNIFEVKNMCLKLLAGFAVITASLLCVSISSALDDQSVNPNLPVIDMSSLPNGVSVNTSGNVQTITTTLDKTIINAQSSNIGAGYTVNFVAPTYDNGNLPSILFRDIGTNPSNINGTVNSNAFLVWVNTNGINIGSTGQINAPSLVLSTRDITNTNFLSANYIFEKQLDKETDRLLLNRGTITISQGGFGVLIAGAIENQGIIVCPVGTIALAGGDAVRLDISSNKLISIAIDREVADTILDYENNPITKQLNNTGTIQANGGTVIFRAEALPGIFERAINLEGVVKADKVARYHVCYP